VLVRKKATTTIRENALPISTDAIVDTATDSGTLQKSRSTIERWRKSWRSVNHAATYPVHKVPGRNAGTAIKLSTDWSTAMDGKLKMRPPHGLPGYSDDWHI
jgi:hypothetical protein